MSGDRKGSGLNVFTVILSVTLSVGATIALFYLRDQGSLSFAPESSTITVPDLEGLDSAIAGDRLLEVGLRLDIDGEEASTEADDGEVLNQSPLPGSSVEEGAVVTVVLSSGPPRSEIPTVVGIPLDEARRRVEEAGYVIGSVDESGEGEPGMVTAVRPAAGTATPRGEAVWLTAAPAASIEVPSLRGKSKRRATEELAALGLVVGEETRGYNEDRPPFVILEHTPAAGTRVAAGTAVNIVVNQ